MKYTYHYYARQLLSPGQGIHVDDVVVLDDPVVTGEDYYGLKVAVVAAVRAKGLKQLSADKLTICSLTLLHEAEAEPGTEGAE